MYIEMELLARERYQTRLREAEQARRGQIGHQPMTARPTRRLPLPRPSRS